MPDLKAASMYLEASHRDLRAVHGMVTNAEFADEIFGFHAQQTAEKALKAWLCLYTDKVPRTHDLSQLAFELENHTGSLPDNLTELLDLTDYAVTLRYADMPLDAHIDRPRTFEIVNGLFSRVRGLIDDALHR